MSQAKPARKPAMSQTKPARKPARSQAKSARKPATTHPERNQTSQKASQEPHQARKPARSQAKPARSQPKKASQGFLCGRARTHWASPYWASHQTRLGRAIKRGWGEPSNEVGRARTKRPLGKPVLVGRASWASHSTFTVANACLALRCPLGTCPLGTVPARRV